jgi:hypothetical protein
MLKHKFKSAWTIMLLEEFIADEQRITSPTSYAKASVQFAGAVSRFLFPKSNSSGHERKEEKKEMLFCFELLGHMPWSFYCLACCQMARANKMSRAEQMVVQEKHIPLNTD